MTQPNIFALGFSHLVVVREAQNVRLRQDRKTFAMTTMLIGQDERHRPFESIVDGQVQYNEIFRNDLADLVAKEQPDSIVGCLWGNQNFFLSTATNPKSFDFILPSEPRRERITGAQLIPYEMMKSFIAVQFQKVDYILDTLKSLTRAPIILVSAPPPMEDFSPIAFGSSDPRIDAQVEKFGVAAPVLRYKFWKLCDEIYREKAAAHGVIVLPPPGDSRTAEGFRRPEYFGPDWIHANLAYGELVLKQIEAIVRGAPKSEAA